MTAVVYQLRDYQNKKDIERLYAENKPLIDAPENIPYGGKGIDGMVFTAPDTDSA